MAHEPVDSSSPADSSRGGCPPVLMILFNRPDLARMVFDRVRLARPAKLYLAIDGPRDPARHPDDVERILRCRELAHQVDWPCEVRTRFSDENQGCGRGPSNAIGWMLGQEPSGIILEDDCVPAASFFRFCAEMLDRYAADPEVMHINGNNFAPSRPGRIYGPHSFGFTRYAQAWGWATWARAWEAFRYDVSGILNEPPEIFRAAGIDRYRMAGHRERVLSTLDEHAHDVWDYQWQYAVMKRRGLCVSPATNLISNHGFGDDATHTKQVFDGITRAATGEMEFPLAYPPEKTESPAINRLYADRMLGESARYRKKALKRWIRGALGLKKNAR